MILIQVDFENLSISCVIIVKKLKPITNINQLIILVIVIVIVNFVVVLEHVFIEVIIYIVIENN